MCIGCRARGTKCLSQEFVGDAPATSNATSEKALDQRVDQLQTMLEMLIHKVDTLERSGPSPHSSETRGSSSNDIVTPMSSPYLASAIVPLAPVFENPIVGQLCLRYLSYGF